MDIKKFNKDKLLQKSKSPKFFTERIIKLLKEAKRTEHINKIAHFIKYFYETGKKKKAKKEFQSFKSSRILQHKKTFIKEFTAISEDSIEIIHHENPLTKTCRPYYASKVINWFAYFNRGAFLIELIDKFKINPFKNNKIGKSVV